MVTKVLSASQPLRLSENQSVHPTSQAEGTNPLEHYFTLFRDNIIGVDQCISTPYGKEIPMLYADWTASGRNYRKIENRITEEIMPLMANTHTETTTTGSAMTYAYREARQMIRKHVNAGPDDLLVMTGSGTTGAVNKLQRMIGLKTPLSDRMRQFRPVVFVTHMEHHSNHTSWLETNAETVVIRPTREGLVDVNHLEELAHRYRNRPLKIAAVTAGSNVTGICPPYRDIARIMHQAQGYCMVDFAASAPYVNIDMHPVAKDEHLDAIYFSPHKFLGGPGSAGVLIFNRSLYRLSVPDQPGGGTVTWTSPWGDRRYIDDVEEREDGGTPPILQTIRVALSLQLKNIMGTRQILLREQEQLAYLWQRLSTIPGLKILASEQPVRLGIVSFIIDGLSYLAGVKMLNDRFGIQTRGGCSCAGTYGHYLLEISKEESFKIQDAIISGYTSAKPGWIRLSIHPTMTNQELCFLADSIEALAEQHQYWIQEYRIDPKTGSLHHKFADTKAAIHRKMIKSLHHTLR